MSFQRVHDSSPKNSQTSSNHNPFASRPFPVQQPQRPQTPEELEKQAFEQDKFEAMGLEVKETRGTITSEESEQLIVLQAKMDSFLQRQWDAVKGQPNLLEIAINNYQAAQKNQSVKQIQPSLLPNKPIRANSTHRSSAPLQPQLNTHQPNRITFTPSPTVSLQAKLTVGQPNDQYEQEADQVAERVMSMSPPSTPNIQRQGQEAWTTNINQKPIASSITPLVRRKPESEEEEAIQPKCDTCEQEEQIQLSPSQIQASSDGTTQAQPSLESRLNATKGGGSPLADGVRNFMEPRFGADFSQVRVHTGSEAVQMNRELGAQAFANGSDVYFGEGKAPGNNELTAHELTHVVQQTGVGNNSIQREDEEQTQSTDSEDSSEQNFAPIQLTSTNWQELQQFGRTIASLLNGIQQIAVVTGSLRIFDMAGNLLGRFPLRGNFRLSSGVYVFAGDGGGRIGIRNHGFAFQSSNPLGVRTEGLSEDLLQRVAARGDSRISHEDWIDVSREVLAMPQLMLVSDTVSSQDESSESEAEMSEEAQEASGLAEGEINEQSRESSRGLQEGGNPDGVPLPEFLRRENQFPAIPATIQGHQVQPVGGTGDYSVNLIPSDTYTAMHLRVVNIGYRWERLNISNAPGVQELQAQYGLLNLSTAPELQEHEAQVRQGEAPEGSEDRQTVGRSESVASGFERATADLQARPEQIYTDEAEAISEGRYLDVLANEINYNLIGLETIARYGSELLGAVANNFHDGNERQIPWEGQGVYIIRCTAVVNPEAEEGTATYAPSVATKVVVVAPLDQVARESLDAPLDEASQIELELAGLRTLPEGDPGRARIPELEQRLRTLEILETGNVTDVIWRNLQLNLNQLLTLIDSSVSLQHGLPDSRARAIQSNFEAQVSQLRLAEERAGISHIADLQLLQTRIDELISAMSSSEQLLQGLTDTHVESLRQEINSLISRLGLDLAQGREYHAATSSSISAMQRVQGTLVSRITGQTYPLLLQIREPSLEGTRWHCQISDVTDQHGSIYDGYATNNGDVETAKLRAVTEALEDFAGGAGYGEGSLAIRLPNEGWFASLSGEQRNQILESRPRDWAAARQRLEELGQAIALLGLVVSSPVLGAVGAGLGAALAAQRFAQRFADGTFTWSDSQNVSDLMDILSAAAVGLGAGVRAFGPMTVVAEGKGFALQLTRGAQRLADAAETAETALDVIGVIHCNAEATLGLISLSGQTGAQARRERARIIAGVIQSNGMFAHQLGEVQGSHSATSRPESSTTFESTDRSDSASSRSERTEAGSDTESLPEPRSLRPEDTVPGVRPIEEENTIPDGTSIDLWPAGLAEYGLSRVEAERSYRASLEADPTREAGIWENIETGEHIVVQGDGMVVPTDWSQDPELGRRFRLVEHYHPGEGLEARFASPEDFAHIMHAQVSGQESRGEVSSQIRWRNPQTGQEVMTEFGYNPDLPDPFWIKYQDADGNWQVEMFGDVPWNAGSDYRRFLQEQGIPVPTIPASESTVAAPRQLPEANTETTSSTPDSSTEISAGDLPQEEIDGFRERLRILGRLPGNHQAAQNSLSTFDEILIRPDLTVDDLRLMMSSLEESLSNRRVLARDGEFITVDMGDSETIALFDQVMLHTSLEGNPHWQSYIELVYQRYQAQDTLEVGSSPRSTDPKAVASTGEMRARFIAAMADHSALPEAIEAVQQHLDRAIAVHGSENAAVTAGDAVWVDSQTGERLNSQTATATLWPSDPIWGVWRVDHIVELQHGGADDVSNYFPVFQRMHSAKSEAMNRFSRLVQDRSSSSRSGADVSSQGEISLSTSEPRFRVAEEPDASGPRFRVAEEPEVAELEEEVEYVTRSRGSTRSRE